MQKGEQRLEIQDEHQVFRTVVSRRCCFHYIRVWVLFNYYTDIETFSSERINGLLKLKF